jgi:hypothetical protein
VQPKNLISILPAVVLLRLERARRKEKKIKVEKLLFYGSPNAKDMQWSF